MASSGGRRQAAGGSAQALMEFAQSPTKPLFTPSPKPEAPSPNFDTRDTRRTLAHRDDCTASQAGADKVARRINGQCRKILDLVRQHPDKTAGELADLSGGELDQVTICKRVSVLERHGAIDVNDQGRICNVRGNLARTYRAKACPEPACPEPAEGVEGGTA